MQSNTEKKKKIDREYLIGRKWAFALIFKNVQPNVPVLKLLSTVALF